MAESAELQNTLAAILASMQKMSVENKVNMQKTIFYKYLIN